MYSQGTANHPVMPLMPPPNFCPPPVYGNVPFQAGFAPPYYPPSCNYYNNPAPYNSPNSKPNFNPFSQPPPGYGPDGNYLSQNSCNGTPTPAASSFQPVHMANVNSPNFAGYGASNVSPVGNQYGRSPYTMNGGAKNNTNRFFNNGNNRRTMEAKDSPYYCEACDRGFMALNKFTEHKSQHITCGQQGCTFSAHEKIVEKHFMMQHRTGLYNRIVKGDSPEEIQKWIAERKKHFPTKEKIEVKEAQREEMKKRGERFAERKQKSNQRNSNFKHGSNNRFNRNNGIQNRHGQFRSRTFDRRRNSSVNLTTDENNQSSSKNRPPMMPEEEEFPLRNLLPFKGTAFYERLENNVEVEEHTIPDDDDIFILSGDEDISIIECYPRTVNRHVIFELEKSSGASQPQDDPGDDCLDKYFKNCDNLEEIDRVFDNRHERDKSVEKCEKSATTGDSEVQKNGPVVVDIPIADKPAVKAISSLALLQCYDSDDASDDEAEDTAEKSTLQVDSSSVNQVILSSDDEAPIEQSSKPPSQVETLPNQSSTSNETECEKNDESTDDSGPEECSSKCPTMDKDNCQINPSIEDDSNENVDPIPCSSTNIDDTKPDISSGNKEDQEDTKGCESKRRRRKRRRDSKNDLDCEEESDKKPTAEPKLPRVIHTRKRYRPPTLLEKLLFSEIKHERNVVLQCIRYAVDRNYFGLGESNPS